MRLVSSLEEIARLARGLGEAGQIDRAIKTTRGLIQETGNSAVSLEKLDRELSIWESKLAVILKEPAGRQGMAKHALYWAEKLKCQMN